MEILFQDQSGISVGRLVSSHERAALLALFGQVAAEQGWETSGQLDAYADAAVHLAVLVGDDLIGGLQLILGKSMPPILAVWPELGLEGRDDVAELALLAFRRECRGKGGLLWLLCVEMWRWCRRHGIKEVWAEATPANLRRYRRLGWPLEVMGPLRTHWGEPCFPCRALVDEMEAETLARRFLGAVPGDGRPGVSA